MKRKGMNEDTKIILGLVLAATIVILLVVYSNHVLSKAGDSGSSTIDDFHNPTVSSLECETCISKGSTPEKCKCDPTGSRGISIDETHVSFTDYSHNPDGGPWSNITLPEGVDENADHIYWVCTLTTGEYSGPWDCYVNKTESPPQLVCHNNPTGSGCETGTIMVKWYYG